ncbi:MAG: hypothetical protein JWQ38_2388 [Flavipsychrobacter sp.]|nr:hypothetical protein [Flavipsychrobacter sp.]
MEIPLTSFEIEVLNQIIPTNKLDHPQTLQFAIHTLIGDHKEHLMQSGNLSDTDFRELQDQTGRHIFQFLKTHDFFHEREGGAMVVNEKMRHLREQGTIENYHEWETADVRRKAEDMRIIQERGYLDRDQNPAEHKDTIWKETKSLDNDEALKNHPAMPAHKFATKPGQISGRGSDQKKTFYPILIALLVLAVVLLARYFKVV